ncbi:hypothetical protein BDV96DRAFT_152135 [Lophiotrema nucula]|uniref:Uncharacterized protein n=1 Tax=Lophiotrema nucula TaxID=690887 RepID=A0A6A5YZE6_9PLEO|nr:hypothetical protein BDV96DRAFT_152135 [Lophiotrema nucula]
MKEMPAVSDADSKETLDEIRVGYFGICTRSANAEWHCVARYQNLPHELLPEAGSNLDKLLQAVQKYKENVLFPVPTVLSMVSSSLAVVVISRFSDLKFGYDRGEFLDLWHSLKHITLPFFMLLYLSAIFSCTAALWQQVSAASVACLADKLGDESVFVNVGPRAVALAWLPAFLDILSFGLTGLVSLAIFRHRYVQDRT